MVAVVAAVPSRCTSGRCTRGRRAPAAVYRRRRVVAALGSCIVLAVTVPALATVAGWLGGGPLAASGPISPPALELRDARLAAGAGHVVQPGDTVWGIARALQPDGDVRPLVARLTAARDGQPLLVGERIRLPAP